MEQITRHECPIGACTWTYDDHGPAGGEPVFFDSAAAMITAYAARVEDVLREHLETHTLLEWVQEVTRLRGELEAARAEDDETTARLTAVGSYWFVDRLDEDDTDYRPAAPWGAFLQLEGSVMQRLSSMTFISQEDALAFIRDEVIGAPLQDGTQP